MNEAALLHVRPGVTLPGTPEGVRCNMAGDYGYMLAGYYRSLDAELAGLTVIPTTEQALDAYVMPIAIEKARQAGLDTPEYDIVTDKLTPPVLAYPINPFSSKAELISEGDDLKAKLRALTMTGKYATICQKLPADTRIDTIRCVLGRTLVQAYTPFAAKTFAAFQVPLMKIRVIVTSSAYLFSAIEPLPYSELTLNEKKLLGQLSTWQK